MMIPYTLMIPSHLTTNLPSPCTIAHLTTSLPSPCTIAPPHHQPPQPLYECLMYEWHTLWVTYFMSDTLYEWHTLWVTHFMSDTLYEWHTLWVTHFMSDKLYEWHTLWATNFMSDILYLTGAREGGFCPGKMQRGGGEGDEGGVGEGDDASTTVGGFVPGEFVCPTNLMLFTCSSLVGGTLHGKHFEFPFSRNRVCVCVCVCEAHCNTLQHTATHCNTLQHTATHHSVRIRIILRVGSKIVWGGYD